MRVKRSSRGSGCSHLKRGLTTLTTIVTCPSYLTFPSLIFLSIKGSRKNSIELWKQNDALRVKFLAHCLAQVKPKCLLLLLKYLYKWACVSLSHALFPLHTSTSSPSQYERKWHYLLIINCLASITFLFLSLVFGRCFYLKQLLWPWTTSAYSSCLWFHHLRVYSFFIWIHLNKNPAAWRRECREWPSLDRTWPWHNPDCQIGLEVLTHDATSSIISPFL